jgi:hypothetical protein
LIPSLIGSIGCTLFLLSIRNALSFIIGVGEFILEGSDDGSSHIPFSSAFYLEPGFKAKVLFLPLEIASFFYEKLELDSFSSSESECLEEPPMKRWLSYVSRDSIFSRILAI